MTVGRAVLLAGALVVATLLPGLVGASAATTAAAENTISITHDGENVTVANTTEQVISGSADIDGAEEVEIVVRSTNDTQPQFYRTRTVTLGINGHWDATFDFSDTQAGDTFVVEVTVVDGSASANATGAVVACEEACAEETAAPSKVSIDTTDGNVTVANASSQVISGTADAPKGTEVTIHLKSTGDTQPRFFKAKTAVVTEDGTWAVAVNFSDNPAGGTFSVEATIEDTEHSASADGHIVACEGDCTDEPPEDTPTAIPEQTPTATPAEAPPPVALNGSAVSAVRGEVAAIEIAFNGADSAVLTIGDEASTNYELQALVRDADGDGDAVLYLDTALAGREGNPVSVSAGNEVTLRSETELGSMLAAGNYEVTLHAGEDADGEPTTLGTLLVQESAENAATDGTATVTDRPEQGGTFDGLGGILLSVVFLAGGGAVALLLVRG